MNRLRRAAPSTPGAASLRPDVHPPASGRNPIPHTGDSEANRKLLGHNTSSLHFRAIERLLQFVIALCICGIGWMVSATAMVMLTGLH